ncbi:MAG TPA: hypothetical protein VE076_05415 [Nitrososphaeraceae archaeon]|nr:hypothetical protein [Nitrososphaeraceae archaeon]
MKCLSTDTTGLPGNPFSAITFTSKIGTPPTHEPHVDLIVPDFTVGFAAHGLKKSLVDSGNPMI